MIKEVHHAVLEMVAVTADSKGVDTSIDIATNILNSGPGYVFWAIVISAAVTLSIGLFTIGMNRVIAKKKEALTLLILTESEKVFIENRGAFYDYHSGGLLTEILEPKTPDAKTAKDKIKAYLNHFEIIAIGINQGILDENLIRSFWGDTIEGIWTRAQPVVIGLRGDEESSDYDPEFFEHLEELVVRWRLTPKPSMYSFFMNLRLGVRGRRHLRKRT